MPNKQSSLTLNPSKRSIFSYVNGYLADHFTFHHPNLLSRDFSNSREHVT